MYGCSKMTFQFPCSVKSILFSGGRDQNCRWSKYLFLNFNIFEIHQDGHFKQCCRPAKSIFIFLPSCKDFHSVDSRQLCQPSLVSYSDSLVQHHTRRNLLHFLCKKRCEGCSIVGFLVKDTSWFRAKLPYAQANGTGQLFCDGLFSFF